MTRRYIEPEDWDQVVDLSAVRRVGDTPELDPPAVNAASESAGDDPARHEWHEPCGADEGIDRCWLCGKAKADHEPAIRPEE
jgi:hypothetical protein